MRSLSQYNLQQVTVIDYGAIVDGRNYNNIEPIDAPLPYPIDKEDDLVVETKTKVL